jgi:hypothetical protein
MLDKYFGEYRYKDGLCISYYYKASRYQGYEITFTNPTIEEVLDNYKPFLPSDNTLGTWVNHRIYKVTLVKSSKIIEVDGLDFKQGDTKIVKNLVCELGIIKESGQTLFKLENEIVKFICDWST